MPRNSLGANKQLGESRKLQLRISPMDEIIIRRAAHIRAETLSEYIRKSALDRAKTTILKG